MRDFPCAVFAERGKVHVQWHDKGEFVTLNDDGSVDTQWREPHGTRLHDSRTNAPAHFRDEDSA